MIIEKNEGKIFEPLCHPLDLTSQTYILNIYNEFHVRVYVGPNLKKWTAKSYLWREIHRVGFQQVNGKNVAIRKQIGYFTLKLIRTNCHIDKYSKWPLFLPRGKNHWTIIMKQIVNKSSSFRQFNVFLVWVRPWEKVGSPMSFWLENEWIATDGHKH